MPQTIGKVAEEEASSDVVVIGNRCTRDRRRRFLQSVPAKVARLCPCSVLIMDTRVAQ
jgi:nucleotide-binding universal stress UspA family protein